MGIVGKISILMILSGVLLGCPGFGDEEPPAVEVENPTFKRDIEPIFERYCNECHSVPAEQGASTYFRLDECEDTDILGAASVNPINLSRMSNVAAPMPPTTYGIMPAPAEIATVQNWQNNGAPCVGTGEPMNNINNENNLNNENNQNNTNNTNNTNNLNNGTVSFTRDVAPILSSGCGLSNCHGRPGGNLNLEIPFGATPAQVQTAISGNSSDGLPFINPGSPETSELWIRMSSEIPSQQMPPPTTGRLPDAEINTVRIWISEGANY